ncbi:MAG TPA: serine hydrolase, partial [Daejeonella sp.]|nr:serine hydrolase [Daejeonella sp.]
KVMTDSSAQSGLPSIEHYIKKILLTSDNDAYNRLFEFIGRAEMNKKLRQNKLTKSRILNRLAIGDAGEAAKHTNPMSFYDGDKLIYSQKAQYDPKDYPLELENLIRGKGYMDANEQLVNEPYSFADKNVYTIEDQQVILKKLFFPEAFSKKERFDLKADDYKLIYKYMSMLPSESDYPKYDSKEFWPTYSKMLFYGREKDAIIDPDVRIFNKYGDSYGYIIDNAYFVDFKNGVEFMLTAVVQSNEDGIYNDGKYEYETICYPFMKNLGRVLYSHELKREKKHLPNLHKFQYRY